MDERTTVLVHQTDEPTKRAFLAVGDFPSREQALEFLPKLVEEWIQSDEDPLSAELVAELVEQVKEQGYLDDYGVGFVLIPFGPEQTS